MEAPPRGARVLPWRALRYHRRLRALSLKADRRGNHIHFIARKHEKRVPR